MSPTWEPILTGSDRDLALDIVSSIASMMCIGISWERSGLMGVSGIAMFLAHAQQAGLGDEFGATELLENGLAALSVGRIGLGLWTGAAGLRWVVSQLTVGVPQKDILRHLDRAIEKRLADDQLDDYDLYAGLAGVLLAYADDDVCGDSVFARVLDHLDRIDFSHPRRNEIGCAHGVAGLLSALARCRAYGRMDVRAEPLMHILVTSLLDVDVEDQRIGWCRGEPGIALSLLGAAYALNRRDLAERATSIALAPFARSSGRWPVDAGLCHGAAGLGHLCNRMYQATGDGRLAEHAHTWLRKTMAMRKADEGFAGFKMFRSKPIPTWEADPSLLVGAAGVGLALLAGATTLTPSWDRVLGADLDARPDVHDR